MASVYPELKTNYIEIEFSVKIISFLIFASHFDVKQVQK